MRLTQPLLGQKLGVLEYWAHKAVRTEPGGAPRIACDESEIDSTLAAGVVVGIISSVCVDINASRAMLPLDGVNPVVTEGSGPGDTIAGAFSLLELGSKCPDSRLLEGMLMSAGGDWDINTCDEVSLPRETPDWLGNETESDTTDAFVEAANVAGAVNSSWIGQVLAPDGREAEIGIAEALDSVAVERSEDRECILLAGLREGADFVEITLGSSGGRITVGLSDAGHGTVPGCPISPGNLDVFSAVIKPILEIGVSNVRLHFDATVGVMEAINVLVIRSEETTGGVTVISVLFASLVPDNL